MAKLKASTRNKLPKTVFGLQGSRRFPMNDASHARAAISGATRSERAGNISPAQEASIKAKARAKLGIKGRPSAGPYLKAKSRASK